MSSVFIFQTGSLLGRTLDVIENLSDSSRQMSKKIEALKKPTNKGQEPRRLSLN
jgi:hypothetical protein